MLQIARNNNSNSQPCSVFCALLFAAVLGLLPVSAQAQGTRTAETAVKAPFTGVWDTVAGSATRYTVQLTQVGNKVTGTYSPHNGKITGGIVVGNKLTFTWTQDGGWAGTGEFTLDPDRKGFAGSSTATKPTAVTHPWKTYKPEPPWSFAGTWAIWKLTSEFSTNITLSISQKGDKITGTFPSKNGTIEGTVIGRNLRFKWESDEGSGSGMFSISTSKVAFGGWFNEGDDPDVEGTRWHGERTSVRGSGSGKDIADGNNESPREKIADPSFEGIWSVLESGLAGALTIKQFGPNVSGVYATPGGAYELKNGNVNRNTLRFTIITRNPGAPVSVAELVLDPGGKSFKGFINANPTTGAFLRSK
jgi:hypothetical protein